MTSGEFICDTPKDTFALGEGLGTTLRGGDVVFLYGGLGAGKTLMTKGVLNALEYDVDEVTSPSFTLVNLYRTPRHDVYHIDLWRLDGADDVASMVGLEEILDSDRNITIIEWADRLSESPPANHLISVYFEGDGDEPRRIAIRHPDGTQE